MTPGKVYIVGAGPGDPGLLTVKALNKLKTADVVVYDRLINNGLISYCKKECERIFVGKESGFHPIKQEQITEILIKKSKQGLNVVRLKGGNPFIFGRGSEEAIDLKNAGIDFEIIPGITSGTAAPIYSGIPITQRGVVTQCVFLTAHESPDKADTQVEWGKLAKMKNTSLIIYMGASRIETISKTLIKFGLDPHSHAAVIENGTLSKQRTITSSLENIPEVFKKNNFKAPSIIMISPTIPLRDDIAWWEKKPLHNKRVVITEACNKENDLCDMLYDLGAEIIHFPVTKTAIVFPRIKLKELFYHNFEWIIFSNENEVNYLFELFDKENLDARILGGKKILAIGSKTKKALKTFGLNSDFATEDFPTTTFTNTFIEANQINGVEFLRIKDDSQDDQITELLNNLGGRVNTLDVYQIISTSPKPEIIKDLQKHGADLFIFTNSATVNTFFNTFGSKTAANLLDNCKSILIDSAPTEALKEKHIQNVKILSDCTVAGLSDFIHEII